LRSAIGVSVVEASALLVVAHGVEVNGIVSAHGCMKALSVSVGEPTPPAGVSVPLWNAVVVWPAHGVAALPALDDVVDVSFGMVVALVSEVVVAVSFGIVARGVTVSIAAGVFPCVCPPLPVETVGTCEEPPELFVDGVAAPPAGPHPAINKTVSTVNNKIRFINFFSHPYS
jgi:hypothetical protein